MIALRPARADDTEAIVTLFRAAREAHLSFLPVLHTRAEDIAHFTGQIATTSVTLAEDAGVSVGFIGVARGRVNHLYVAPDRVGEGIGSRLLDYAKADADRLELWCFQQNTGARRFYQARGFVAVRETAGENEEGLPDLLYRWQR